MHMYIGIPYSVCARLRCANLLSTMSSDLSGVEAAGEAAGGGAVAAASQLCAAGGGGVQLAAGRPEAERHAAAGSRARRAACGECYCCCHHRTSDSCSPELPPRSSASFILCDSSAAHPLKTDHPADEGRQDGRQLRHQCAQQRGRPAVAPLAARHACCSCKTVSSIRRIAGKCDT